MERIQKIVVALLIISVILSVVSVVINVSVLNFEKDSNYNYVNSNSGNAGSGKIELVVEEAPSGASNG